MQLFRNALILDPQNVSMLALMVAAAAWLVVLVPILADLWQQTDIGILGKLFLAVIVLGLPGVGGILYAIISIIRGLQKSQT